jgi:hypothetical protein
VEAFDLLSLSALTTIGADVDVNALKSQGAKYTESHSQKPTPKSVLFQVI